VRASPAGGVAVVVDVVVAVSVGVGEDFGILFFETAGKIERAYYTVHERVDACEVPWRAYLRYYTTHVTSVSWDNERVIFLGQLRYDDRYQFRDIRTPRRKGKERDTQRREGEKKVPHTLEKASTHFSATLRATASRPPLSSILIAWPTCRRACAVASARIVVAWASPRATLICSSCRASETRMEDCFVPAKWEVTNVT
jgi:hypothetical protein